MIFSNKDIYEAVQNYLPTVSQYVNSHGGDIDLLATKDGVVYIKLTGACGGCSMSLMTTKMVVQKKLRELISEELIVENIDNLDQIPNDAYSLKKDGMIDKIKHAIGL
jgi:Fe-S cluster biogenesis protein NfuA